MALVIWLGTTDGDVTTGTNWSGGSQPTTGDDVIITGTVSIDGGTLSAAGNLASFVVRDYSGTIGSEDAALVIDLAASSTVTIDGSAKMYLDFNASDVDVDVYGTAQASGNTMGLHLTGSGTNSLNVYNRSSVLLLETLDNDINTFSTNATVITAEGADATNFTGPGRLIAYGDITNIYATGKDVDYHGAAATTIQAENGARINYWSDAVVTNSYAYGGTIDLKDVNTSRASTNNDVKAGGTIIFGRNRVPTNMPSAAGSYELSAA